MGGRNLLLTYAAGTDPTTLEPRLEADYGVSFTPYSRPDPPGRLLQLDLMGGLLRGLGAFLIGLGVVGLVHFLGVSARRRRHDFGVLRALGFVRRDLSLTMSWQAMSVVAIGVVVGVPLGVMVGRWAWLAAIGSVGMVDTPAVPPGRAGDRRARRRRRRCGARRDPGLVRRSPSPRRRVEVRMMSAATVVAGSQFRRAWRSLLMLGVLVALGVRPGDGRDRRRPPYRERRRPGRRDAQKRGTCW